MDNVIILRHFNDVIIAVFENYMDFRNQSLHLF